jgi:cytochrome c553
MHLQVGAAALTVAALATPAAWSQDLAAGRAKAQQLCAVCHGPIGLATSPDAPHLAGHSAIYTATQLRAYRNGTRKHEVMAVIAKQLSDEDIAALAAWYAAIKVEAKLPE